MISPHTPPGTKIVCIDDGAHGKFMIACQVVTDCMDGLTNGTTYTVAEIVEFPYAIGSFVVVLNEISRPKCLDLSIEVPGFALARFRYAELPRSILQCLNVTPADIAKHKERSKVREKLFEAMRKAWM